MKNREIITAIDNALNHVDSAIRNCRMPKNKRIQGNAEVLMQFEREREALREARAFIAARRKDD